MEETRFMDIYSNLADNGIDVYSPAQHEGECTSPYVVVKDAGVTRYQQFSSVQALYDIMCYVPKNRFTELEKYVGRVKEIMKRLEPMIMPTHTELASFYDDTVNGHMVSIQYRNYRKI
jgi:hypothetical protein